MDMKKIIRISGVLAISGGLLNAVSDLLLYSGPVSGKDITLEFLATLPYPYHLTLAGAIIGAAVAVPLWIFILVPLYYALNQVGAWFRIPVLVLFGYLFILSGTYHGAYAFYGAGFRAAAQAGVDSAELFTQMIDRFMMFKNTLGIMWFATAVTGSGWFIAAVFSRETRFPKWAALWTPVMSVPVSLLSSFIPAPAGGYIRPMASTLAITLFFVMVAQFAWNYEE